MAGPDVFISYSRVNRPVAEKLAAALEGDGLDVWWDSDLIAGTRFRATIEKKLASTKVAIVLWSEASIKSDWVLGEAGTARRRGILVPATLEHCVPPIEYRQLHTVDLTDWSDGTSDTALHALANAVKQRLDPNYVPPVLELPVVRFWQTKPARRAMAAAGALLVAGAVAMTLIMPTALSQKACQQWGVCLSNVARVQSVTPLAAGFFAVELDKPAGSGALMSDAAALLAMTSPTRGVLHNADTPEVGDFAPRSQAGPDAHDRFAQAVTALPAGPLLAMVDQVPGLLEIQDLSAAVLQDLPQAAPPQTCPELLEAAQVTALRARFGDPLDAPALLRLKLLNEALSCDRTQLPALFQTD